MKKVNLVALVIAMFFVSSTLMAAEFIYDPGFQYTDGMAQAADVQNHGEIAGDMGQFEVGGFGNGSGMVNYYSAGPEYADGSATAEVISNGYSFFYEDNMGGESHSSNVVQSAVQTQGTLGQAEFQSAAEQSVWANFSGDLRFAYGYNKTIIHNEGSINEEGPLSAENISTATGYTKINFNEGDGTRSTEVKSYGEAYNSNPSLQSNFNAEGGYGGGDTLIIDNASVQGQFFGMFQATNTMQNIVQGGGVVNLTNRFEEGVGQVVRAEVSSFSSVSGLE